MIRKALAVSISIALLVAVLLSRMALVGNFSERRCLLYGMVAVMVAHVGSGLLVIIASRVMDVDVRMRPP